MAAAVSNVIPLRLSQKEPRWLLLLLLLLLLSHFLMLQPLQPPQVQQPQHGRLAPLPSPLPTHLIWPFLPPQYFC